MENQFAERSKPFNSTEYLETRVLVNRMVSRLGKQQAESKIRFGDWLLIFDEADRKMLVEKHFLGEVGYIAEHKKFFESKIGGRLSLADCIDQADSKFSAARAAALKSFKIFQAVFVLVMVLTVAGLFTLASDFSLGTLFTSTIIIFLFLMVFDGALYLYQLKKCQIIKTTATLFRIAEQRES